MRQPTLYEINLGFALFVPGDIGTLHLLRHLPKEEWETYKQANLEGHWSQTGWDSLPRFGG